MGNDFLVSGQGSVYIDRISRGLTKERIKVVSLAPLILWNIKTGEVMKVSGDKERLLLRVIQQENICD